MKAVATFTLFVTLIMGLIGGTVDGLYRSYKAQQIAASNAPTDKAAATEAFAAEIIGTGAIENLVDDQGQAIQIIMQLGQ